jgi:hypothetical protein
MSNSALGGILLVLLGYKERDIVLLQWLQKVGKDFIFEQCCVLYYHFLTMA